MKFTFSWLKEFLETSDSSQQIAETLSMIGLEVESLHNPGAALQAFKVAQIMEATPHPDADRLRVCRVDTGQEILQIVCGAPNAAAGLKVVLAPEGTRIPANGLIIKKTSIRGVESTGMLCSAAELGLDVPGEGIIALPLDAPVGESYATYAGLDDPIFDIAITPNRGDCLGVYGVARDLAAAGRGQLQPMRWPEPAKSVASTLQVKIDPESAPFCPVFMGREIQGVRNGPSPLWMQQRLRAVGVRPKSALVDITNYLLLSYGRPMHAFDRDKLTGDLQVRPAHAGETIVALNEVEYTLDPTMTVVADANGTVAVAGIIGGAASGCCAETTHVFLESALFVPEPLMLTGRALNVSTDARYRFERGVDAALVPHCLDAATAFILDHCGGTAGPIVQAGQIPTAIREIDFCPHSVEKRTGVVLPFTQIAQILTNLGFEVDQTKTVWRVRVPSWRHDSTIGADLVEEVVRIYGYDHIPTLEMPALAEPNRFESYPGQQSRYRSAWGIRRLLAAQGYHEAMTWSFVSAHQAKLFGGGTPALQLVNPLNAELTDMRPSLLPLLLTCAQSNADRGYPNTALFEVGTQFAAQDIDGQAPMVSGVRTGLRQARHWGAPAADVDIYAVKRDAMAVLESCGLAPSKVQVVPQGPLYYHPGRCGTLRLGPKTLGYFGEIHPQVAQELGLTETAVAFEIFLNNIPLGKSSGRIPAYQRATLQPISRDFAFVVDAKTAAGAVVKAVQSADKKIIKNVIIFDVYEGPHVASGSKSIALSVTLQPEESTFTESDLAALGQKIVNCVYETVGGSLRT